MKKRIVVYWLVSALTLYCFFMYENPVLSGVLAAEVWYFFFSSAVLFWLRRRVAVSIGRILPVAEKNQTITVRLEVKNHSPVPGVHYRIRGMVSNQFTGERQKIVLDGSVGGKAGAVNEFAFRVSSCGNLAVEIKELILYDMCGILTIRKKLSLSQKTGILPECHILPLEVTKRTREFVADAEEYSDRESGDDPAEIYQIREYREKDSIHDIHWKLSAKSDELLVKEHGRPLGCVVLIWIDLEKGQDRRVPGRRRRMKTDQTRALVLEAAASLSLSLLEEKCVHMAAWYEKENRRIAKKRISREEHVYELMYRLLLADAYEGSEEIAAARREAFRFERFSSVVELDGKGKIVVNGEPGYQLDGAVDTDWDKVALTV